MATVHKLIDLDFAPGIKSEHINKNFELIHDWICRERLRIGGWGIVEGFELSYDAKNFVVTVGEGTLINQDGEEVTVPEWTFGAGELEYRTVTKKYKVDSEGKVVLGDYPYDPNTKKYITYNPPNSVMSVSEDVFYVFDEDGFYVPIVRIVGKNLWVNATEYKNRTISVTQTIVGDRIDTIMLHKDGTYEYLWSIDSPSPSHVDIADYDDTFCIGVVYWSVTSEGINCDFFINHRSYRNVYVDENNTLYLNGEVYVKPKFIYFEEPDEGEREENDLWYNVKDNTLYIWRYRDGEWGWVIVNDHSEIVIRERKIWYPKDNPMDLKTFKFEQEELNLRFVPGTNALTVLVDNAPLMDDQYTELQVNDSEILKLKEKIETIKEKLSKEENDYAELEEERKNLEGSIQVLRKDISDSYSLYPQIYDDTSGEYQINQNDIPNLQNLMTINKRIAARLEELAKLLNKLDASKTLIESYEEQIKVLTSITDGTYVSTGIGFQLKRPLSHAAYVEVIVTHVVRMKPARETFQRAAIFVREGDITVTGDPLFVTASAYSVGDDQLEVFVDGVRLSKGLNEFNEVVELSDTEKADLGVNYINYNYVDSSHKENYYQRSSRTFKINTDLSEAKNVSYRISKHVWSYDQLDALIGNIRDYAFNAFENAQKALEIVTDIEDNVNNAINAIREDIGVVKTEIEFVKNNYMKLDTVDWKYMPNKVKTNMVGTPIDIWVVFNKTNVLELRVEKDYDEASGKNIITGGDVFNVYYVDDNMTRLLNPISRYIPNKFIDYDIESGDSGTNAIIEILNEDLGGPNAYLHIVGFRRGLEE